MLRLTIAGPDTVIGSSLCPSCPYSAAGCCVAPPRMAWADVARVALHGGGEWLLEQVAAGNLIVFEHGLSLLRVKGRVGTDIKTPRIKKCVFHGPTGCTIAETRRPSTCNYYVCDKAIEEGEHAQRGTGVRAEREHDKLVSLFTRADASLQASIDAHWPAGVSFDPNFLEWLVERFAAWRSARSDATA